MHSVARLLGLAGYEPLTARDEGVRAVIEARAVIETRSGAAPWPAELRPSCPLCGAKPARQYLHGWRCRRVAHLPVGARPCDLLLYFPRLRCQACGRTHTPPLPGIARRSRLSSALRAFVSFLMVRLGAAVEQLRRWLHLSWDTP